MSQKASFKFDWMNNGQPFILDTKRLSMGANRRVLTAFKAAKLDAYKQMEGIPKELMKDALETALMDAYISVMTQMIQDGLATVDPAVKEMSLEDVMDKLDNDEYVALIQALVPESARKQVQEGKDPLGQLSMMPKIS